MSKILKYRQYLLTGYEEKVLSLSERTVVYLTEQSIDLNRIHSDVVIRTEEKPEAAHAYRIGNSWYLFMDMVKLTDVPFPVCKIEECKPPKECYIVVRSEKKDVRRILDELCLSGDEIPADEIMEVISISKIKRLTPKGFEVALLQLKDLEQKDHVSAEMRYWEYRFAWIRSFILGRECFFTSDLKYKRLFDDTLERYYKLFKE